jgi:hypothetical protein
MKNKLNGTLDKQYNELIDSVLPELISIVPKKKYRNLFNKIYFLWYFSHRKELSSWLANDYYIYACSFAYEAFVSLFLKQLAATSLLLRSSTENFLKFLLDINNLDIDSTRFKQNASNFRRTLKCQKLISNIDKLLCIYDNLSSLSHSANSSTVDMISYLSSVTRSSETMQESTIVTFNEVLHIYSDFIISICKPSLKKWDSEDLENILYTTFKEKKAGNIISFLRK